MLDTPSVIVKDKEERRLSKVKIAIMRNPKFALWSGLMTVGKTRVSDDIPTACTNGRDETYGREFIKMLDDKELAFVVLHETLHKAFRHLFTWKKLWDEDKQLANMACDYVINLMLLDMDTSNNVIAMPQHQGKAVGLVDEKYRGLNAKQVFDLLKEDKKNGEGMFGEGQPCEADGEGGQGFDDHDWEGAKELDADTKKELEREIDQALRQGVITDNKVNGNGAGGLNREISELLEPEVNWRELLREFVKSTCSAKDASSWRRVNRRYLGTGVYMPSLIGERVGHLVIGIDTSGSIGGDELNEFLSEVKGIADEVHPEKVDLIYWDSGVAGHEVYDANDVSNIVSSTKPMGGGGTDPTCVHHYLKEHNIKPEAVIMLTDGCIGDWGNEWEAPMLWTVVRNPRAYAPVGKTIHIKN
jgi:predicted metal-dependent peptidase